MSKYTIEFKTKGLNGFTHRKILVDGQPSVSHVNEVFSGSDEVEFLTIRRIPEAVLKKTLLKETK